MRKTLVLVTVLALMASLVIAGPNATIQPSDPDDIILDEDNGYSVEKQFDGSNSEGTIESYSWSLEEDGASGSGVTHNFTFDRSNPQSDTLQLTVSNGSEHPNGSDVDEVTQDLQDVPNISINPSSDQTINKGDSIDFKSFVTNEFDDAVSYNWTIDGNQNSTNANFSHTFDNTGDFDINLTVNDNVGADSKEITVTVESSSNNDSEDNNNGGNGGAAGASTTSAAQTTYIFPDFEPGETDNMTIDDPGRYGIEKLSIKVSQGAKDVSVTVEKQDGAPADVDVQVSGSVYRYLNIESDNINDSATENVGIRFSVNKSWINGNNFQESEIHLKRYHDGNWDKLDTTKKSETDDQVQYKADSPGLSYFAVSGETDIVKDQNESEENATEEAFCGDNTCQDSESWISCSEDCPKPDRVKDLEDTISTLKEQFGEESETFQLLENATNKLASGDYEAAKNLVDQAKESTGGSVLSTILTILLVIIVIGAGGFAYWWFVEGGEDEEEEEPVAF